MTSAGLSCSAKRVHSLQWLVPCPGPLLPLSRSRCSAKPWCSPCSSEAGCDFQPSSQFLAGGLPWLDRSPGTMPDFEYCHLAFFQNCVLLAERTHSDIQTAWPNLSSSYPLTAAHWPAWRPPGDEPASEDGPWPLCPTGSWLLPPSHGLC